MVTISHIFLCKHSHIHRRQVVDLEAVGPEAVVREEGSLVLEEVHNLPVEHQDWTRRVLRQA